jgi:hypothetical protein
MKTRFSPCDRRVALHEVGVGLEVCLSFVKTASFTKLDRADDEDDNR